MSDAENTLVMELEGGSVTIALRPDLAPKHVERIKSLAREGFYDGLTFHRVIEGFMAQGGCPQGTGRGGTGDKLPAEFSAHTHARGVCSMARTNDPNSADCQFFICLAPATFLDRQYTVWGAVTEGMEHVDALPRGEPPRKPGKIVSLSVAADAA
jgi:peptidylprolyl isomerase